MCANACGPSRFNTKACTLASTVLALALSPPTAAPRPIELEPAATINFPGVTAVAIDGDELVVGASGARSGAYLFRRNSDGVWTLQQTLVSSHGAGGATPSVAIRGNLIAVHYPGATASALAIFERTAGGWQSRPVELGSNPFAQPYYRADVEIDGDTVLLGGGPIGDSLYCDANNMRALRKNASGAWVVIDTASSDARHLFDPPEATCMEDIDVAISGNAAIVSALELADSPASFADFIVSGPPGSWGAPIRMSDYRNPVALENGVALLTGTEVFELAAGAWTFRQSLQRPDRLLLRLPGSRPSVAELRNGFAVVGYADGVSVFRRDASANFSEVARLRTPGSEYPPQDPDAPESGPPWYPVSVDIAGRRIALNDVYSENVGVFELPPDLAAPAVIQDTFEDGNSAGWTPLAGSKWSVANTAYTKVYRQSSTAGGAGAFLGDMDWTNQSIQVDVKPRAFSGADRWFGLVVRRTDASNYYYLTVRSSGSIQLRKMVNGAVHTIASAGLVASLNQNYRLRLEAIGQTISAYSGDRLILRTVDTSLTHGQAGVQMYKAAADYDNVVVTPNASLRLMENSFPQENDLQPLWTPTGLSQWSVEEYRWFVQSSTQGNAGALTGISTHDQSVEAVIAPTSFNGADRWYGLMARYQDASNHYYVTLRSSNRIALRKLVNGAVRELDSAPLTVSPGTAHRVRLEAIGDQLRVYVDGQLMLEAADNTFAEGRYGLSMYKAAARFTNVVVTQP